MTTGFITRTERPSMTIVIIVVIAALLLGGLWYIRGRRA
jgi:FtsZ-interacting cell division protein ZipA